MSNEQAPDSCPFCGAGITVLSDGRQCRASDGEWVAFTCLTSWHRNHPTRRSLQSRPCESAERERLTRELETCRQRSAEKDLWIEDLKKRLQLVQSDLAVRIKEVKGVEKERDEVRTLAARRGEVLEKLVSKASASLASAGIHEGELGDRIEWVCALKKQLEEERGDWKRCADNLHEAILVAQQDADFLSYQATEDAMDEFDALTAKEAKP